MQKITKMTARQFKITNDYSHVKTLVPVLRDAV